MLASLSLLVLGAAAADEQDWNELQACLPERYAVLVIEDTPPRAVWVEASGVRSRELLSFEELEDKNRILVDRLRLAPGPGTFPATLRASRDLARLVLDDWEERLLGGHIDVLALVAPESLSDLPLCALALGDETVQRAVDARFVGPGAGVATVLTPSLERLHGGLLAQGEPRTALLIGAGADLPWVAEELEIVRGHLSELSCRTAAGSSGAGALRGIRVTSPDYLHVAAHGTPGRDGEEPQLLFEGLGVGPRELAGLGVAPRLVNLAACHSDAGGHFRRLFLDAGADHVVTFRWRLDDRAALLFNAFFYGQLTDGPVLAMHRARFMIRNLHPEPFYWATARLSGTPFGSPPQAYHVTRQEFEGGPAARLPARSGRAAWLLVAALSLAVFVLALWRGLQPGEEVWLGRWTHDGDRIHAVLQAGVPDLEENTPKNFLTKLRMQLSKNLTGTLDLNEDGTFSANLESPDGRPMALTGTWKVAQHELRLFNELLEPYEMRAWLVEEHLYLGEDQPMYTFRR